MEIDNRIDSLTDCLVCGGDRFGEAMADGRLTEPSAESCYRLRDAIALSRSLGRQLTAQEMQQFAV